MSLTLPTRFRPTTRRALAGTRFLSAAVAVLPAVTRHVLIVLPMLAVAADAAAYTITGVVRDRVSQQPIAGAQVTFYTPYIMQFPDRVGTATTDADGRYQLTPAFGNRFYGIARADGHAARASDDRRCELYAECLLFSSAVEPDPNGEVTADFALARGAVVGGRVADRDSGVRPYRVEGQLQPLAPDSPQLRRTIHVDPDGRFRAADLHDGAYALHFTASHDDSGRRNYLAYTWPEQFCDNVQVACNSPTKNPLVLVEGGTVQDLAIDLRRGSLLRVRLRSGGSGEFIHQETQVSSPQRPAFHLSGHTWIDDDYAQVGPLLPGAVTVALFPDAPEAFNAVIYPDRACNRWNCDLTGAPTVTVPEADDVYTLPDVYTDPLRTIRGRVTSTDGQPLAGIAVSSGVLRQPPVSGFYADATALTDANGDYLLEGSSYDPVVVRTQQTGQHWLDQAWQGITCDGGNLFCELRGMYGQLSFQSQAHHVDVDFVLAGGGGTLEGLVAEEGTLMPKAGYAVFVVPTTNPRRGKFVMTGTGGRFRVDGLPAGSYYLIALTYPYSGGTVDGIAYPANSPCGFDADGWSTCPQPATGSVTLGAGGTLSDLRILLPRSPTIFTDGFEP